MPSQRIWDFWADRYESLWVQKYSLGPTRRAIMQVLEKFVRPGVSLSVLDMGCGTGQMLREIKQKWPSEVHCLGVDAASQMIKIAREKSEGIEFRVANIEDFQVAAESLDLIICAHSLPYYTRQAEAVAKLAGFLKKDGLLLLAQASANSFYDKLAMGLVKLTTSKASYPGIDEILNLTRLYFAKVDTLIIKEKFYMPTIGLFICQK
jgi:ubiquinone/menaquinone biosynthesis C-methylase UbiE